MQCNVETQLKIHRIRPWRSFGSVDDVIRWKIQVVIIYLQEELSTAWFSSLSDMHNVCAAWTSRHRCAWWGKGRSEMVGSSWLIVLESTVVGAHQMPTTKVHSFSHPHMEQKLRRSPEVALDDIHFLLERVILRISQNGQE